MNNVQRRFMYLLIPFFMLLTVAGCGTINLGIEEPPLDDVEAENTVNALKTEVSALATLATEISLQETQASGATQIPKASANPNIWNEYPIAGIVFRSDHTLWQLDAEGNPEELMSLDLGMEDFQLSPKGDRVLCSYRDDIWIVDLNTGERRNITQTDDRRESRPYWWSARPEVILFTSAEGTAEQGTLAVSKLDGSEYKVLGEKPMYSPPAPSPDGELIAFQTEYVEGVQTISDAWIYHWDGNLERIDSMTYNLGVNGFDGVSWVPGECN